MEDAKNRHLGTIAQLCQTISSQLRHVSTIGTKVLNSNVSPTCTHNMVNFGPLAIEICWRVWGTHANFNGFRVLAASLHGTLVVGVSQTLWCWTEGAIYIRQGGHHVGYWPTFLVFFLFTALPEDYVQAFCTGVLHHAVVRCDSTAFSFSSLMPFLSLNQQCQTLNGAQSTNANQPWSIN